jgi:hypothetical protein
VFSSGIWIKGTSSRHSSLCFLLIKTTILDEAQVLENSSLMHNIDIQQHILIIKILSFVGIVKII